MQAQQGLVSMRDVSKSLDVYPELADFLLVGTDMDEDSDADDEDYVEVFGEDQLRIHVAELASTLLQERLAEAATMPEEDFRPHSASLQVSTAESGIVQVAKNFRKVQQEVVSALWDEELDILETQPERIADLLNKSAKRRQGRDHGDDSQGQRFLAHWTGDLRGCRTSLAPTEMAEILASTPEHKKPGPNGVPGIVCKRYAAIFVDPFIEAMQQLQDVSAAIPLSLGERVWKVIPKVPGADRQNLVRDLELPNGHRKVLARAFAKILDEQATRTISNCQHAFLSQRNISNANVELAEAYYRGVDRAMLRYWLLLDCTKGHNLLSWRWLRRVLTGAGLNDGLMLAIDRMVQHGSAVILVHLTRTSRPLFLRSGLAQGCPLSCVLYVLVVDPFLDYLSRHVDGVGSVIGFCDDWNVECESLHVVWNVQEIAGEFEQASGQRFNRTKSKVLPTRDLQYHEEQGLTQGLTVRWRDCRIVSAAKVLGLWLGYGFHLGQLGLEIEAQYYERMRTLRMLTASWAARVVLLNVFLRSLWSYVNRHHLLSQALRSRVERHDLDFVTRMTYFPCGFLSHLKGLYKINVNMQDFELANIAGLIATAWLVESGGSRAATLVRESTADGVGYRSHMRPSSAFATAYGFFLHTTGRTVHATLDGHRGSTTAEGPPPVFKIVYKKLLEADYGNWRSYWSRRLCHRGLDAESIEASIRSLPAATSQADRWNLMKLHMNAHATSARLRFIRDGLAVDVCPLCEREQDSVDHIFGRCGVVMRAKAVLVSHVGSADLSALTVPRHNLQGIPNGQQAQCILRLDSAILSARWLCRSRQFASEADAVAHICDLFDAPGLSGSVPAKNRQQRRQERRKPPIERPGFALYRTDGAARGQGGRRRGPARSGWGAVCLGQQPADEADRLEAWGYLGEDVSNNIAEYTALFQASVHAESCGHGRVCMQTDS